MFAGSWCNNILHRSFVSIHYIKNIILSFQFVVTNVEGMDILASYKCWKFHHQSLFSWWCPLKPLQPVFTAAIRELSWRPFPCFDFLTLGGLFLSCIVCSVALSFFILHLPSYKRLTLHFCWTFSFSGCSCLFYFSHCGNFVSAMPHVYLLLVIFIFTISSRFLLLFSCSL